MLVDLRHGATHNQLPSMATLRIAVDAVRTCVRNVDKRAWLKSIALVTRVWVIVLLGVAK